MDIAAAANDLNHLGYGYIGSWALLTACKRRVFDRLPASAADLADEYPDAELVTTWFSVLEADGILVRDGDQWAPTEAMSKLLVGDNSYSDYLGGQILEQMTPRLMLGHPGENELDRVLANPGDRQGYEGWFADEAEAHRYQESQYAGSLGPARTLARKIAPKGAVLDLGGGWGAVAGAVAARHDVPVDVLDLAPVVASAPAAEGVTFKAGSALDPATWPTQGYDGAILSYLLSSVPGDTHAAVISALADRNIQWIALHDFLLGGGDLAPAWSLQHAVFVPGHVSRSVDGVGDLLRSAGFSTIQSEPVVDDMTTLVLAAR